MSKRLSAILLFIILVAITVYVTSNWNHFKRIRHIDKKFFLHQSILSVLMICVNGYMTKVFLALFKVELELKEWFGLALLTALGNYLTPFRGGMALKGIYLKRRLEFPYSTFVSTVAASYILVFLVGGILGIATLLLIFGLYETVQWKLLSFFFIMSVTMASIFLFCPTIRNPKSRLMHMLKNTLDGWHIIRKNIGLITKVSVLIVFNYIIISARLYYGYRMLQIDVSVLPAFLMSLLTGFAILIAITPGNLGVQETTIGLISKLIGPGFNRGLMVSGILRVVDVTIVFALGPIYMHLLLKKREVNSAVGKRGTGQV